jgi:hypothetical protein
MVKYISLGTQGNLLKRLLDDKVYILLIAVFSLIYLPQIFIAIGDLGLLSAFETDPGSIVASIEGLFQKPYYNMLHSGYHSKFYGWTYYVINFIVLAPIKFALLVLNIQDKIIIYFVIRAILFLIGLLSVLTFYALAKALFVGRIIPMFASSLYLTMPVGAEHSPFFFIHPESTGLLFLFIAILCLLKFIQCSNNYKLYFWSVTCLALASLSKQIFFFVSLPVIFSFFHFYSVQNNKTYLQVFRISEFYKISICTLVLSFAILCAIHPYAILDFSTFFFHQKELSDGAQHGEKSVSLIASLIEWFKVLWRYPLVICYGLVVVPSFIICAWKYKTQKQAKQFLFIANTLGLIAVLAIISFANRTFFWDHYLQPLYPFFILGLLAIVNYLMLRINVDNKPLKHLTQVTFVLFLSFVLLKNLITIAPILNKRLQFPESLAYKTFHYINKNTNSDDKIVYDHFVAMPEARGKQSCHYWHGCGTDHIEEYSPNIVMFNPAFTFQGEKHAPTERLKKYVKESGFPLVTTITDRGTNILVYRK